MTWTHDALAADLAAHLRRPDRMVWEDMQMGSMHSARPDVWTLQKSYSKPGPRAYEVKVRKADFRADITKGKWSKYLSFSETVTFATPHGLISLEELPPGTGLMIRSERGWSTRRKPTITPLRDGLPQEVLLKLLIDGVERQRDRGPKGADVWLHDKKARQLLGEDVARAMRDREWAARELNRLTAQVKIHRDIRDDLIKEAGIAGKLDETMAEIERLRAELMKVIGFPEGHKWNQYHVQSRIIDLSHEVREDSRVNKLQSKLNYLRSTLDDVDAGESLLMRMALNYPESPDS